MKHILLGWGNEYEMLIIPGYWSWCIIVHCRRNGIYKSCSWILFCHWRYSSSSITVKCVFISGFLYIPAGVPWHLFPPSWDCCKMLLPCHGIPRGICEVSVVAITVELSIVAFFAIQFSQHLAHDKHISCNQEVLNKYKRICSFLATLRYIIALNNNNNNNNMPKNWRWNCLSGSKNCSVQLLEMEPQTSILGLCPPAGYQMLCTWTEPGTSIPQTLGHWLLTCEDLECSPLYSTSLAPLG